MKGALIGFGTIAGGHLQAYEKLDNLSIIAIVDSAKERFDKAKAVNGDLRFYQDIDELFANEKVDFIDVCTPPHTHLGYIKTGLNNNCHILCEKPFLCSVKDYKGLLPLIKKSGKTLYACHNYKFAPILQKIYGQVQSKDFGKVVKGHFRTLRSGHAVGIPEWKPNWRREQKIANGGILRDHGTHSVYMATHITNNLPVAVSCLMGSLKKDQYTDNEDTALLTLYFPNDTQFLIDLSWAASFRNSYYSVTGTDQTIIVENDEITYTKDNKVLKENLPSDFNDPTHKTWFVDLLKDFLEFIHSPERQIPLLTEALMTTLVIEKAYGSAKLGGAKVDIPHPSIEFLN